MPRGVYQRNSGQKPWNWRGGYLSRGYRYIPSGERYRNGKMKYRAEHRIIAAQAIARAITSREHVHHKNLNRSDNRPENLEVLPSHIHQRLHQKLRVPPAICNGCGKAFKPKRNRHRIYCSRECYAQSTRKKKNKYICLSCGRLFLRRGIRKAQFCSRDCRYS